jgi:hypothetical protein
MVVVPRPWRPLVRAIALLVATVLALRFSGATTVGVVALWALTDALLVLAGACGRYDAERPWALSLFEGVIQVALAAFVWVWWTAPSSMLADTLGSLIAALSLGVLGAGAYALWAGDREGRVPAGAIGALVLVVVGMGSSHTTAEFRVVLAAYLGAFVLACAHRSFELARRRPAGVRGVLAPHAWSASLVGAVVVIAALAALGVHG